MKLTRHRKDAVKDKSRIIELGIVLALVFMSLAFIFVQDYTGYVFIEPSTVEFDVNSSWNLSNGFTRVSQGGDVFDNEIIIVVDKIVIELTDYNLTNGTVYVDLIVNETVVDSEVVDYGSNPLEVLGTQDEVLGVLDGGTGDPDSCGNLTADLTLNASITANGTCFSVLASHIVIDGNGFTITGNGSEYGVNNSAGYDNITVKNFAGINNFTTGIYFDDGNGSTIYNNTIESYNITNGYGIEISGLWLSKDVINVTNNTITTLGTDADGISATSYNFSTFSFNTISVLGSGSSNEGIIIASVGNSTISSNTINMSGNSNSGIFVSASCDTNLVTLNNIISDQGASGIYLWRSNFSTFTYNVINTTGEAIFLGPGSYNNFTSNNLTHNQLWSWSIRMDEGSDHNTFNSNYVSFVGTSNGAMVGLNSANNNTFTSNILNASTITTFSDGFELLDSNYTIIDSNTIILPSSSSDGISLENSSWSNITSNTIIGYAAGTRGINFIDRSNFNNVSYNNISVNGTSSEGLYFSSGIRNTARNDILIVANANDIDVDDGEGILINVTFGKTDVSFDAGAIGNLTVKWYVDVNVSDTSYSALLNANVTTYNSSNAYVNSSLAGSNGLISTLTLTDFWKNSSSTVYSTPHSINVSLLGYRDNSTSVNLTSTNSTLVTVFLPKNTLPTVENLTLNSTSLNNYSSNDIFTNWTFLDGDEDSEQSNEIKWIKSRVLQTSLTNNSIIKSGNLSGGEIWNVSVRVYDGNNWSDWSSNISITIVAVPAVAEEAAAAGGGSGGGRRAVSEIEEEEEEEEIEEPEEFEEVEEKIIVTLIEEERDGIPLLGKNIFNMLTEFVSKAFTSLSNTSIEIWAEFQTFSGEIGSQIVDFIGAVKFNLYKLLVTIWEDYEDFVYSVSSVLKNFVLINWVWLLFMLISVLMGGVGGYLIRSKIKEKKN